MKLRCRDRSTRPRFGRAIVAAALVAASVIALPSAPAGASTGGTATADGLVGEVFTVEVLDETIFTGFPIDIVSSGTPAPDANGNGAASDSVPSFSLGAGVVTGDAVVGDTLRTTDGLGASASVTDISLNFFGIPIVGADLLSSSVSCPIDELATPTTASVDDLLGLTLAGSPAVPGDSAEILVPVDTDFDDEEVYLLVSITSPTATSADDASAAALRIEISFQVRVFGLPVLTVDFVDVALARSTCSRPAGSAPVAAGISPTSGPVGTSVTLTGSGFVPGATSVDFGGLTIDPADVVVLTTPAASYGTSLTFEVPGAAPLGSTSVTATTPVGTTSALSFDVLPPAPAATSLSPGSGPVGTSVTVQGSNFVPGATTITIGGVAVPAADVVVGAGGTSSSFLVPGAVAVGSTTVTVATAGGDSDPLPFTVTEPVPSATSLSPGNGPAGTTVTVEGAGFVPGGTSVVFGDSVLAPDQVSVSDDGTELTFVVPAGTAPGTYQVRVETVGGESGVLDFTVTASSGGGGDDGGGSDGGGGGGILPFTGSGDALPLLAGGGLLAAIGAVAALAAGLGRRRRSV